MPEQKAQPEQVGRAIERAGACVSIEIRYKTAHGGYGAAEICTDSQGRFEWRMPADVRDVYFGAQGIRGNVRLPDEGICPKLWRPNESARYQPVHVSPITGWLRGEVVIALVASAATASSR